MSESNFDFYIDAEGMLRVASRKVIAQWRKKPKIKATKPATIGKKAPLKKAAPVAPSKYPDWVIVDPRKTMSRETWEP